MGYDLHIVRQHNWDDYEEDSNITLEEWLDYVKTDPELQLTNGFSTEMPGIYPGSWQDRPGFCEWTGHPNADAAALPWLEYYKGSISTKNPDDETVKKMLSIAEKLNGKLRGDDGEFYDESYYTNGGYPVDHADENKLTDVPAKTAGKKPWWKFW